jgi:hydroxymethylglutaryl-CoA synthase
LVLAYGSGSKSKVFGKIGENWKQVVEKWNIFDELNKKQQ